MGWGFATKNAITANVKWEKPAECWIKVNVDGADRGWYYPLLSRNLPILVSSFSRAIGQTTALPLSGFERWQVD